MKKRKSMEDIIMDTVIMVVLVLFTFICVYPVWFVLMASFSSSTAVDMSHGVLFWPVNFSLKTDKNRNPLRIREKSLFFNGFQLFYVSFWRVKRTRKFTRLATNWQQILSVWNHNFIHFCTQFFFGSVAICILLHIVSKGMAHKQVL